MVKNDRAAPLQTRALTLLAACVTLSPVPANGGPFAQETEYTERVLPVLERYCFPCHGPEKQKSDLRLDTLDPDLVNGPNADDWHVALDMIQGGEMPPRKSSQPTDDERRVVVSWLTDSLREAAAAKKGERRVVLRRLTRQQYTFSLQELLGVRMDFGRALPSDGKSEMGFSNCGEVLQASTLHLEYFQAIAREAVERTIFVGAQPEPTWYRIRFGTGIGEGKVAGHTGGYQSVPLNTNHFVVELLDARGEPKVPADEEERAELDGVRRRISVGLRGSSQDRFQVVDRGVLLYSAVPHKEKAPKAWQGPSPNLKLEMQRCFPETGDFAMRVRASRGYLIPKPDQLLVSLEDPAPRAVLDDETRGFIAPEPSVVLLATASDERKNVVLDGDTLRAEDVTEPSLARLAVRLEEEGYYQVDLVHPAVAGDAMPSVRLRLGGQTLDLRLDPTDEELTHERMVTPIGAAFLRRGQHHLKVGGPFFVGFSQLVLTPLSDDHPLILRLNQKTEEIEASLEGKVPAIRTFAGTRTDDGMDYKTFGAPQEVLAPLGAAEDFTFIGRLEDLPIPEPESGDKEELSGFMVLGLWNDHLVKATSEPGPPLLIESIEIEAPHHPVWPPRSHTDIFFESEHRGDEEVYTREVVTRFMERAFRRPPTDAEVERYLGFWREVRGDFEPYEDGVREVLIAVLCSPNFLYLAEPSAAASESGVLSDDELASRLSYFLWSSPPDRALNDLAREGRLREELGSQVDRMLEDPRAWRFVRAFAREWLRLDRLEDMTINVDAHPAFTRFVKRDMAEETVQFLHHVLVENESLFTLVDSDFAMLNQNLAEFYGIDGVQGPDFRAVAVSPEMGRGGLLSQGAFLAGHSDGTEPHPIKRAVWLKEKILGDPPPPPPPNVPDLDPDTPGFEKLTLKEQLEAHRQNPSCVDCHAGLDPYGVVFEEYNAVGLLQAERKGKPVDASTTLPDGTEVVGVAALKAYIRDQVPEEFASSLIAHLYSYALGRDLHFADEPELAAIREQVESEQYRMRSVIRNIVMSPSFLSP